MRHIYIFILLLILPLPAAARDLLMQNATLIDGTGAPARKIKNLLIRDDRIAGFDVSPPPPNCEILDLKGAWIMPGLIDAHVHLSGFAGDREVMQEKLKRAVRGGVTGLRDMAGDARVLSDTVDALRYGDYTGPTLVYSGLVGGAAMFDDPRVLEASQGYEAGEAPWLRAWRPDGDAAAIMANIKKTGARAVKFYGNIDRQDALTLIPAAKKAGLMTWAHASTFPARPSDLVEAGADVLSHAAYFVWQDVAEMPADYNVRKNGPYAGHDPSGESYTALINAMTSKGVILDATLFVHYTQALVENQPLRDTTATAFTWAADFTRRAHQAGVRIAAGTDALFPSKKQDPDQDDPPNLHKELELLVNYAGFSPMQAIIAGTRNSAAAAGLLEDHGTIEAGKVADLIILNRDPLRDITVTTDIRLVIRAGKIVHE